MVKLCYGTNVHFYFVPFHATSYQPKSIHPFQFCLLWYIYLSVQYKTYPLSRISWVVLYYRVCIYVKRSVYMICTKKKQCANLKAPTQLTYSTVVYMKPNAPLRKELSADTSIPSYIIPKYGLLYAMFIYDTNGWMFI